MSTPPRVKLKKEALERIRSGHLWVYRRDAAAIEGAVVNGGPADVVDPEGGLVARGAINERSQILVRIWTHREDEKVGAALLRQRLDQALAFRESCGIPVELARIVNGEGDRIPGLIVDRYGAHVVVQVQSLALEEMRDTIGGWIRDRFPGCRIFERSDTRARELEGLPPRSGDWEAPAGALAAEAEADVEVRPGMRLRFDLVGGQKTGGFLDQLENQRVVGRLLRGRRVLDAFCNEGGFGISALAEGAARVLFVDVSGPALHRLKRNLELNGLGERADFLQMNAFDALRSFDRQGARFDAAVLDPPAFTKSRAQLDSAYRGYKEINLRALRLLAPGGLLFTSSCSYHVSREMFRDMLRDAAADAGRIVRILEERGPGRDHPELLAMPETRYLKCILAHVE